MASQDVYCTLLMSDSYLPGAAVLAHSLRDCGISKKIACLVTVDSLLYDTLTQLKKIFDYVIPVEKIANPSLDNLARLGRLDLRFAFTKIALWKQEQFRRIVYIDADCVALRAPDELFDSSHAFAAAPDIGWPDCFNSGVMVLTPNMGDYWSLQTMASNGTSFDGADQGLFNEYFRNRPWHRLSFTYNCTPSSSYQYEPAFRHFRSSISMMHFIGKEKPWQMGRYATNRSQSAVYKDLVGRWWSVYDRHYKARYTSALGQVSATDRHIQQLVNDEDSNSAVAWAATGRVSEERETASQLAEMSWDATRAAPPQQSKAEAAAFPSKHYEMSQSTGLFRAPQAYPAPPTDMYYQVPPRSEAKPAPIFPWESTARKPTRVFAEAPTSAPPKPPDATLTKTTEDDAATSVPDSIPLSKIASPTAALDSFTRANAWDNVSSIDHYVRAVRETQVKRGATQVLFHDANSALEEDEGVEDVKSRQARRRESLIITDFPTEVERPSLPVTPAPRQRPTFWGEERDEHGELPAAEGVPEQSDWNPHERLEQLRRTSVAAAEDLPKPSLVKEAPLRAVPETSTVVGSSTAEAPETTINSSQSTT